MSDNIEENYYRSKASSIDGNNSEVKFIEPLKVKEVARFRSAGTPSSSTAVIFPVKEDGKRAGRKHLFIPIEEFVSTSIDGFNKYPENFIELLVNQIFEMEFKSTAFHGLLPTSHSKVEISHFDFPEPIPGYYGTYLSDDWQHPKIANPRPNSKPLHSSTEEIEKSFQDTDLVK